MSFKILLDIEKHVLRIKQKNSEILSVYKGTWLLPNAYKLVGYGDIKVYDIM